MTCLCGDNACIAEHPPAPIQHHLVFYLYPCLINMRFEEQLCCCEIANIACALGRGGVHIITEEKEKSP